MDHLAGVVVVEADVSVLVAGDGEGQGGVGQHRGDRTHGLPGHGVLVREKQHITAGLLNYTS